MHLQDSSTSRYVVPEPLRLSGPYLGDTSHIDALPPLDTHEFAWAAGFFDGEGCSYLGRHGARAVPTPCLEVNQLHPAVLHRFQAAAGGIGSMRLRPDQRKRRPNPMWSWATRNWRSTQAVLTLLWPYLGDVKREQAGRVFATYQSLAAEHPNLGRSRMRKLSDAQKSEICDRFAAGGVTKWQLGREYGVTDVMIGVIVRGERPNTNEALVWNALLGAWVR